MMLMLEAFITDRPSSHHSDVLKRGNIKISFNIEEIEWYASVVVERVQGDATEFYCALTSGDYLREKGKTCGISEVAMTRRDPDPRLVLATQARTP